MRKFTIRMLGLAAVGVFSGSAAAAGIMMPASAEQSTETTEKTIVSRESWTGSYVVDGKSYDNMTYVAIVYENGSVEIKGQHTYNWTNTEGWSKTFELGVIWFNDSDYKESFDFIKESQFLTTIENYDTDKMGYSFTLFNDTKTLSTGLLFDFKLTPKSNLKKETVIDVFGHEITVSLNANTPTETAVDDKDAKIADLEAQVARLQEELAAAQKAVPGGTGDVNADGNINAKDATLVLMYAAYRGTGGTLSLDDWRNK